MRHGSAFSGCSVAGFTAETTPTLHVLRGDAERSSDLVNCRFISGEIRCVASFAVASLALFFPVSLGT